MNLSTSPVSAARVRPVTGTHMPAFVFQTGKDLARHAAQIIARLIRERTDLGQTTVLGLSTGSTPLGTFRELIRLHQEEGLDFSHVVAFALDEFYGLGPHEPQSHRVALREHLLKHINIPERQIHCLDGMVAANEVETECRRYEHAIQSAGGFDLVLLGLGRNGHIGFNEPFSMRKSRTRLCTLDPITRQSCASDFFGQ
ncbi:MAG TPA: glucosamine-6-phosphate deaminase, partial [Planctomycetaceae bacterium]|nr:glucosamine-6-phosphate deaminase [Planctomycetaceae bacterium]